MVLVASDAKRLRASKLPSVQLTPLWFEVDTHPCHHWPRRAPSEFRVFSLGPQKGTRKLIVKAVLPRLAERFEPNSDSALMTGVGARLPEAELPQGCRREGLLWSRSSYER